MIRALSFLCVLLVLLTACGPPALTPRFEQTWIRAAPPGSEVLAGYVNIANPTADELVITRAESADFEAVQFHEMRMQNGVMQMRPLGELRIVAGTTLELAPGGTHLMLQRPKRVLRAGDRVVIDFHVADLRYSLSFEVK